MTSKDSSRRHDGVLRCRSGKGDWCLDGRIGEKS